jgi:hypothetical protein
MISIAMSAASIERKRDLFREANEGIAEIARRLDSEEGARFEFLCECGDCAEGP